MIDWGLGRYEHTASELKPVARHVVSLAELSVAGRPVLEQAGTYGEVRERALSALRQGNEDPQAFRVSSPYRVIEIRLAG